MVKTTKRFTPFERAFENMTQRILTYYHCKVDEHEDVKKVKDELYRLFDKTLVKTKDNSLVLELEEKANELSRLMMWKLYIQGLEDGQKRIDMQNLQVIKPVKPEEDLELYELIYG